jgi:CheY-like chemotaxis protein
VKRRILIIEDDADQRFIEKTHLHAAGYETIEAGNAREGIDIAISEKPDLILMDVRLPYKKKGIGAAKILRNTNVTRDIPIIFVTAYSTLEESKEVRNIDKSAYLLKPYEPSVLLKHIEKLLE